MMKKWKKNWKILKIDYFRKKYEKDASYSNCGESYFLVKGIINDTSFYDRRNKNKINLIPGMKATARIKVRTEPLYLYIFKHLEL